MLQYVTAGESHGKGIVVVIRGFPSNMEVDLNFINEELARRQRGFGSGPRMDMEKDRVEILSGIRFCKTIGSPIAILVENKDYQNWLDVMTPEGSPPPDYNPVTIPRPGHADLAGLIKYRFKDIRNVIERASARETVGRVVAGAFAKIFLRYFGVSVGGFVESIGGVRAEGDLTFLEKVARASHSLLRTFDKKQEEKMISLIEKAKEEGDTLGGTFVVGASGLVPGLGSYTEAELRLDSQIAGALMSIPGIKGVEIGEGFLSAQKRGSEVHDAIFYDSLREGFPFVRRSCYSGGLEGGVTWGDFLWARCAMKPIPTLRKGLPSVDLSTLEEVPARFERSDVCAVPRALVVAESVLAFVLAQNYYRKFGGDAIEETLEAYRNYQQYISNFAGRQKGRG
ncbi:MAG: chorismate synthase [Candidatus Atribacteria bacterium]|uniref:chorismate synthase n=1 Tax=Atrimonas thermophila TaxID=3064161 RepID=UPI0024ABC769|nr:chorismate synthase [Candidatus Atribacteria bacterium]